MRYLRVHAVGVHPATKADKDKIYYSIAYTVEDDDMPKYELQDCGLDDEIVIASPGLPVRVQSDAVTESAPEVRASAPTVRVSPGRIRAPFGDDMRDPPPHVGCMLAVVLVLLFALAWYSVI